METTQMPINGLMDKKDLLHIHNGMLFCHENGSYPPTCNNMDGPGGYYAKLNKSDRERQILYDFTYMWNLNKKTNEET